MTIKLPDSIRWNGREIQIEGAMERALKSDTSTSAPEQEQQEPISVQNLNGYVYVPSINLYFAKERTLQSTDWHNTHKQLYNQTLNLPHKPKLRMPAIEETWGLIFYLEDNLRNPEYRKLYDDILKTTPKDSWHGEWQNAIFSEENKIMYVQKVTGIDANGNLGFSAKVRLEDCLKQGGWADISNKVNLTSQGLCNTASSKTNYEQGKNIYFWTPISGHVAGFDAYLAWACLDCGGGPGGSDASLGVRACAIGAPRAKNSRR